LLFALLMEKKRLLVFLSLLASACELEAPPEPSGGARADQGGPTYVRMGELKLGGAAVSGTFEKGKRLTFDLTIVGDTTVGVVPGETLETREIVVWRKGGAKLHAVTTPAWVVSPGDYQIILNFSDEPGRKYALSLIDRGPDGRGQAWNGRDGFYAQTEIDARLTPGERTEQAKVWQQEVMDHANADWTRKGVHEATGGGTYAWVYFDLPGQAWHVERRERGAVGANPCGTALNEEKAGGALAASCRLSLGGSRGPTVELWVWRKARS
jgi:hypothetical protein